MRLRRVYVQSEIYLIFSCSRQSRLLGEALETKLKPGKGIRADFADRMIRFGSDRKFRASKFLLIGSDPSWKKSWSDRRPDLKFADRIGDRIGLARRLRYQMLWIVLAPSLREWVSLIWASSKVISRQTSKGDIPKTFVTNRTNLRGNFKLNSNLIQSHLRRHLRF